MADNTDQVSATLVATAKTYLEAISRLDAGLLSSVLSDGYTHIFAPSSAGLGPPVARDDFVSRFSTLRAVLRSYPVRVKQAWPSPSARQVTVWAESEADFHPHIRSGSPPEEGKTWTSRGEYMFVFCMTDDGRTVEQAVEFVDSNATEAMRALVFKAFQRKKEVEERTDEELRQMS